LKNFREVLTLRSFGAMKNDFFTTNFENENEFLHKNNGFCG